MFSRYVLRFTATSLIAFGIPAQAQTEVQRILVQDSTIDNLVQPPDYQAAAPATLGAVVRAGNGPRAMILIPGLGFGARVFTPLMERWKERYRMIAVTLAGFDGTHAPPVPPAGTSFGAQSWSAGALQALESLIEEERLTDIVVVGHWLTGTQLALQLAIRHPDLVSAVILLSGSARWVPGSGPLPPGGIPLEVRVRQIDENLAPRWFRTVTRETWDDNNFLPGDYAVNPVLGLRLWREAAMPPLHVWVRYLCEFFAQDVTLELDRLQIPTILVRPGLDGLYFDPGNNYLASYLERSWEGIIESHDRFQTAVVPQTRVVSWAERGEVVDSVVTRFLQEEGGR